MNEIMSRTKSALKQFGFLLLILVVFLAFYGALPQAEYREIAIASQSPIYVYKMISAKTVYYQFIVVQLNHTVNAVQVSISTWFWLHVSIHIFINNVEIAQVNSGSSGSANFYTAFPYPPAQNFIVEVWAHNMLPLPDDFHANIILFDS